MPYVDFSPLIHELIVRDLSIAAFMNELLVAHENAHPKYNWAPLKELDFDECESLLERWLVRADKNDRFAKLRDADAEIDTAYLDTAPDVLELAKQAKSLLETRSRDEKRDFLARLVCNPRLDGRTVRFDLKKPFAVIAKMRSANDWRPYVDEFRTALIDLKLAA